MTTDQAIGLVRIILPLGAGISGFIGLLFLGLCLQWRNSTRWQIFALTIIATLFVANIWTTIVTDRIATPPSWNVGIIVAISIAVLFGHWWQVYYWLRRWMADVASTTS